MQTTADGHLSCLLRHRRRCLIFVVRPLRIRVVAEVWSVGESSYLPYRPRDSQQTVRFQSGLQVFSEHFEMSGRFLIGL